MSRLALVVLFLARSAEAHVLDAAPPTGSFGFWQALTMVILAGVAAPYALGVTRLWRRAGVGRGLSLARSLSFVAGMLMVAASLFSPLHDIGDRLFAAHMVQHVLLMMVGAPLLALGAASGIFAWSLPRSMRKNFAALTRLLRPATYPGVATTLHGIALWAWHVPTAYAAALSNDAMHWLQHASLLGSALLFWQAVLGRRGWTSPGAAIASLFLTALHTSLLGVLLAFAPAPLYLGQSSGAHDLGLSAIQDQQLAGLIMWVPGGVIYAAAALALAAIWIAGSSRRSASRVRPA